MTHVVIRAQGIPEWNERLAGMKTRILKPGPYLQKYIIPELERVEQAQFDSQGRRGGGSWRYLNVDYRFRKIREGHSDLINIRTGRMLYSLTHSKSSNAIRQIEGDRLVFGTTAKGSAQSQKFRPILRFNQYDRRRWARLWLDYIVEVSRV